MRRPNEINALKLKHKIVIIYFIKSMYYLSISNLLIDFSLIINN